MYEVKIEQLTRSIIPFFFENVLIEASRYGVIKCLDWAANSSFCVARVMGNPVRNGYVFEKMAQAASENGHIAVFEWINQVVSAPRPPADPSKYAKYNFFNLKAIKNICRLDISCIQWLKEIRGEKFLDHWFEFSYVCIDKKKTEAYSKFKEELMKIATGDTVAFLSDHFYED